MTDRELLQFAAKAAGIEFSWLGRGARLDRKPGVMQPYVPWNPLEDDGDALRLAVELKLELRFSTRDIMVNQGFKDCQVSVYGADSYAATRRIITLAAAEIGKAMS